MKFKGTTLICTAVLMLILGMGIETQTVQASDTSSIDSNEHVEHSSAVITDSGDATGNDLVVQPNEILDSHPYNSHYPGGDFNITPDEATPKNNFYVASERDYLQAANAFSSELTEQNSTDQSSPDQQVITQKFDEFTAGDEQVPNENVQKAVNYYQNYIDQMNSNNINYDAFKSDIQSIADINNYQELSNRLPELARNGFELPFQLDWMPGYLAQGQNVLIYSHPNTGNIPSTGLGEDETTSKSEYYESNSKLFSMLGFNQTDTEKILTNAINFNSLLNESIRSDTDPAFIKALTDKSSIIPIDSFYNQTGNLDFKTYVKNAYPDASKILIADSPFLTKASSIFNQSNFEMMKDWILTTNIQLNYYYFGKPGQQANNILTGGQPDLESDAYDAIQGYFSDILSNYYGQQTLPNSAVQKVTTMIDNIIAAYKQRIEKNNWLSDSGKASVLDKLNNMKVYVGYPSKVPEKGDFSSLNLSQGESIRDMEREINNYTFDLHTKEFSQYAPYTAWQTPSWYQNAEYMTVDNSFTIYDGILTTQYISDDYSDSQNYGGLGVVIGHEISHAFDSDGSHYDKDGNYSDIWTREDRQNFTNLTDKMVKEYNGVPLFGHSINGENTLAENIADNGGLNVALEVAKSLPDFNANEFFTAYAQTLAAPVDASYYSEDAFKESHSPDALRANIGVQNLDDFYKTYDVKPGDPMWLDPAKRVNIW